MKTCPATVIMPSRAAPALLETESVTVALAVPLPPFETAIHGALLTALQAQPLSVVTATERPPPAAEMDASDGAIAYVHGAAAWLTAS